MPWELSAVPADSRPSLGSIAQVQELLRRALPRIQLFRDASGSEKIRAMEAQGIEIPQAIREAMMISGGAYQGLLEGNGWSIEFWLGQGADSVTSVSMDVRGSGDPMPAIQRIMAIPGWKVVDVNGTTPTRESWAAFGNWRDDAIEQLGDEE